AAPVLARSDAREVHARRQRANPRQAEDGASRLVAERQVVPRARQCPGPRGVRLLLELSPQASTVEIDTSADAGQLARGHEPAQLPRRDAQLVRLSRRHHAAGLLKVRGEETRPGLDVWAGARHPRTMPKLRGAR